MHSDYGFGFMMRITFLYQNIQAKRVLEDEIAKHKVTFKSCRADNVRFSDLGLKEEVIKCNQIITCCGIGTHGENGNAERYVGKVTKRSRIMLLRAKRFWSGAITHMFWTFVVSETINVMNYLSVDSSRKKPTQKLTSTNATIMLRNQYKLG